MIRTRPLQPRDEPAWRVLWRAYLAFYETDLPQEVYAASFSRLTDPRILDYHGLIAEDAEGRPMGLVHYIFHSHGWRLEQVTYLQDLYVAPQARGAGAGG